MVLKRLYFPPMKKHETSFILDIQTYIGESKIMKKIIISALLIMIGTPIYASCPINTPGVCKADIGPGINDRLDDKLIPNNLNQISQPNNTFNNRTQLGQPNVPENINMEPAQEESTQPYNADCQFGNCMNRTNVGEQSNKR